MATLSHQARSTGRRSGWSRPLVVAACLGAGAAQAALPGAHPYADLSLEELANVVITSVARRPQALARAAASVFGIEAFGEWQVERDWRLRGGLVLLDKDLRLIPGSNDPTGPANLGNDPKHQWSLRSSHNLGERIEFEAALRRMGALPQPAVPAYTAVDLRLVWQVDPRVDVTFAASNAFDPGHVEYRLDPYSAEIERSFLVGLRLQLP